MASAESFFILRHSDNKIELSLLKIIGGTAAILVLLIVAVVLGHREFRARQQHRLVTEANALVGQGDFKRAGLDARRLLQINPESAEACRIIARISEKTGARSALAWRRRVVELNTATAADWIALGQTALRFSDWTAVSLALNKIAEGDKDSADYHAFLAEIGFARGDGSETVRQLAEAIRIDPARKEYLWRLATVQLGASDFHVREKGLTTLRELEGDPALRRDALKSLIEDAMRQKNSAAALAMARKFDVLPEKNFADRLLLLAALQAARDPGFRLTLQQTQARAIENAEDIGVLMAWMNGHEMAAGTIDWGAKLSPAQRQNRLVAVALSDSYVATGDWPGMQQFVKSENWGEIDYLRSALAARALRELGNETGAQTQWREAVKKVIAAPKQALVLAEIVQKWGWETENTELLWIAARDPDKGDEALQTLYVRFAKIGATQDLYRVCLHREEFHPADRDIQNNVAQLSLLLNLNVERARSLARGLFEQEPGNAAYASTYAFSLLHFGDPRKALQVMDGLNDAQLHQPEIAAYYGLMLAAVDETARAAEFLALGETAKLLPEEKALVEKAQRALAKSSVARLQPLPIAISNYGGKLQRCPIRAAFACLRPSSPQ